MDPELAINLGLRSPYDSTDETGGPVMGVPPAGYQVADWAHVAALAVLMDLGDRRGIKWELQKVDDDVRPGIVRDLAAIIRAAHARD